MERYKHYKDAFILYLRSQGIPYKESKDWHRKAFKDAGIRPFDLIIYLEKDSIITQVKGRKARAGSVNSVIEDPWLTEEDIDTMRLWQKILGKGFKAAFTFAFLLPTKTLPSIANFIYQGNKYSFKLIYLEDYTANMKERSKKWKTKIILPAAFKRYSFKI